MLDGDDVALCLNRLAQRTADREARFALSRGKVGIPIDAALRPRREQRVQQIRRERRSATLRIPRAEPGVPGFALLGRQRGSLLATLRVDRVAVPNEQGAMVGLPLLTVSGFPCFE